MSFRDDRVRGWRDAEVQSPPAARRGKEQPCPHPDRLLASRAENPSVVISHQVCGNLILQPYD